MEPLYFRCIRHVRINYRALFSLVRNSGDDDGVIFATPYCGAADPLWNATFSWHTDHPDFTPCFQMTFLATVPCAFLLLASPFHFFRLRSSSRGYIKRSVFHYGKVAAISLMILLTLIDFGSTLWYRIRSEGYMDPVYIATPAILHVTLLIAGASEVRYCILRATTTSAPPVHHHLFFLLRYHQLDASLFQLELVFIREINLSWILTFLVWLFEDRLELNSGIRPQNS